MTRLLSAATLAVCLIGSAAQAATYSDWAALPFGKQLDYFIGEMDNYFSVSQAAGGRMETRAAHFRMCMARSRMGYGHVIQNMDEIVARRPDLLTSDLVTIALVHLQEFCGDPPA